MTLHFATGGAVISKYRHTIAVRDWIRGPLGLLGHAHAQHGPVLNEPAVDGHQAQRLWQQRYEESYQREVALSLVWEEESFAGVIRGRADGIWLTEKGWLVEEVKLATQLGRAGERLAWAQLQAYGFLLAREHELSEVHLLLSLVDSQGQCVQQTRQTWTTADLESEFWRLREAWSVMLRARAAAAEERRRFWSELPFPFEQTRPQQDEMVADIIQAHECGHFVFLRAGTGIGKTAAALYGSLVCMGQAGREQLVYTTVKNSGRQAVLNAFEGWWRQGVHATLLVLEAADRLCSECGSSEYVSTEHLDQIVDLESAHWQYLAERLADEPCWDSAAVKRWADHLQVCAHALCLGLRSWADVVLADVHFIFDPQSQPRHWLKPERSMLVVDEAHHLIGRVQEACQARLSYTQVMQLQNYFSGDVDAGHLADLGSLFLELEQERAESGEARLIFDQAPRRWLEVLPGLLDFLDERAAEQRWMTAEQAASVRAVYHFIRTTLVAGEGWVAYFMPLGTDAEIGWRCCNPREVVSSRWHSFASGVFMSATLEPFDAWVELLGYRESDDQASYSGSTRDDQIAVGIATGIELSLAKREEGVPALIRWIQVVERSTPGHVVVFLPSMTYLNQVWPRLNSANGGRRRLRQELGMGTRDRLSLLEDFAQAERATLVALLGGSFAEGISLAQGKVGSVVIASTGLAPPTLETELSRWYFDETQDQGFEYAYFYPAVQKLWQAAGRLIRGPADRGFLLLCDRRFARHPWPDYFPSHWPEATALSSPKQLAGQMNDFFGSPG